MPLTTLEQRQMDMSETYNDAMDLSSRDNAETLSILIEDDLNYIRTLQKELKGSTNWYDTPAESISDLASRTKMEDKYMIRRVQLLTDITVGAGNNFVVLSQAGGETPTEVAAVSGTQEGAIVAVLTGDVGSHSLTEIAGENAIRPKNLLYIV